MFRACSICIQQHLPFLNQKRENNHRNDFINNFHENVVGELESELATPVSVVRRSTDCAIERGLRLGDGVQWCGEGVYLTSSGNQMILACSWARPAILVAGKGRRGMFLFLLFLHFHSCSPFFPVPLFHFLSSSISSIFSPFLLETTQNDPQGLRVVKLQRNQSIKVFCCWLQVC